MKAISWEKWMKNPSIKAEFEDCGHDDLIWIDPVTETVFYIKRKKYIKIFNELKSLLQRSTAEQCYEILNAAPVPFGQMPEVQRAIHLPYFKDLAEKTLKKRTRISDHLLIRSGLYYAVHHPPSNDWRNLRHSLLQVHCEIAEDIDNFLIKGEWPSNEIPKVDVVKAGAVKIKQYLMETSSIQEIRGASLLLDDINRSRISELCKKDLSPEVLIYSGGGNMLLILPEGTGANFAKQIENMFKKITVSAQAVAEFATVGLNELSRESFKDTLGWLEMKKTERQMTMLRFDETQSDSNINYLYSNDHPSRLKQTVTYKQSIGNTNSSDMDDLLSIQGERQICELCKKRNAQVQISDYKDNSPYTCYSCLHKIITGRNTDTYLSEIREVLSNQNIIFTPRKFSDNISDILEHPSKEYIAVINGDGNNMGGVVEGISSLQVYRYFSQLTDYITKFSVYLSIAEVIKETQRNSKANFEIIGIGGDDVFLIVAGKYGLDLSKVIGKKFDQAFMSYKETDKKLKEEETITLSVGVCIAEPKIPFATLFNTAGELIKSAKKLKKQNAEKIKGGTVDFIKLKTSTPFASGLENYRNLYSIEEVFHAGEIKTFKKLMRPYTWEQLELLDEWMKNLKQSIPTARSLIYQFRDIVETMTVEEAKLYYYYYICANKGSKKQRDEREQFRKLLYNANSFREGMLKRDEIFYIGKENMNGQESEIIYSVWHDMVELWDIKEVTEK